jgi:pSer/pThr/pTyr-binding forkhead associated (FHA) protein
MARLILSLRGRELDKFLIGQGKLVIGRSPESDIKIDNPAISRKHALVEYTGDGYVVQDLGSSNGSYLNGQRITEPSTLKPGDVIGIAKFELQFQDDARSEIEKMTGEMDMEATMMVDSEKMAKSFSSTGTSEAPAPSGPRKLVVLKGEANTKELPIERDTVTIGKASSCDLVVKGFFLDKIEATLTYKDGKYILAPFGGAVKLHEEKLEKPKALKVGDTFTVGKTVLAFT